MVHNVKSHYGPSVVSWWLLSSATDCSEVNGFRSPKTGAVFAKQTDIEARTKVGAEASAESGAEINSDVEAGADTGTNNAERR